MARLCFAWTVPSGPGKADALDEATEGRTDLTQLTTMEERQVVLLGVLIDKSDLLGKMYVGALRARSDVDNPEYLSQSCHSIRELIDNLPMYFEVPVQRTGSLNVEVRALQDAWQRESRVRNGNKDALSERFARKAEGFFAWFAENFSNRREVARATVRDLDASGRRMPTPIEDSRAGEWMIIRDWFVRSTHHGSCTADEFDQWIYQFEMFLLNLAKPRPFDNADIIDELVAEGEANG